MSTNPRHLRPPLVSVTDVLSRFASLHVGATCLQIGANDGKSNDPIHEHIIKKKWRAILVEPQSSVFENELKKTYRGVEHVYLERCATAGSQGELPLYKIAFTEERWATGLSSFDKSSLIQHIDRGYVDRKAQASGIKIPLDRAGYITTEIVPTMSPQTILDKHGFKHLDILCVDTEGFDYQVLRFFDWQKFRPKLVLFESKNLSDNDFASAKALLTAHGYNLYWQKGDTLALHDSIMHEFPILLRLYCRIKAFVKKV